MHQLYVKRQHQQSTKLVRKHFQGLAWRSRVLVTGFRTQLSANHDGVRQVVGKLEVELSSSLGPCLSNLRQPKGPRPLKAEAPSPANWNNPADFQSKEMASDRCYKSRTLVFIQTGGIYANRTFQRAPNKAPTDTA